MIRILWLRRCQLVPGLDCTVYVTETGPVMSVDMQHKHVRTDTVWNNMCQVVITWAAVVVARDWGAGCQR